MLKTTQESHPFTPKVTSAEVKVPRQITKTRQKTKQKRQKTAQQITNPQQDTKEDKNPRRDKKQKQKRQKNKHRKAPIRSKTNQPDATQIGHPTHHSLATLVLVRFSAGN